MQGRWRVGPSGTGGSGFVRIGEYLIERLRAHGVEHVFGVPGDFVLGFYDQLERSEMMVVNTCDEQGAGFAADAYARLRGLGAVCVTYGVGGLKLANTTGQAYAESSPVVVISGAPGLAEREAQPRLHHKVRVFDTQRLVFEQLTVASTVLDDPATACREIDRVLGVAVRQKRPVYVELPRDMALVEVPRPAPGAHQEPLPRSHPAALAAALAETTALLAAARRPVVVLGLEVQRFGLQEKTLRLIERTGIPVAVTLLGKSAIGEQHPRFLGVYAGRMGREDVRAYVEDSDCVLLLGAPLSDVDLGGDATPLDPARTIQVEAECLSVGHHVYEKVRLADFIGALADADLPPRDAVDLPRPPRDDAPTIPGAPITVARLFARLAGFLTDETVVIAEPGDALFGAADLPVRQCAEFLAPAYYASLGFAVPAAIGAQLADPALRPLVLVGDGAFQMTGMELATAARFGLNPIVVLLNNAGYVTERLMVDGPFNDVLPWAYHRIPEILGTGRGFAVETEGDLDAALRAATAQPDGFCLLDVRLDPGDVSPALRRLTARFGAAALAEA